MIRCYYTQETIDIVSKSGRYRAIGCGGLWYGWLVIGLVGIAIQDPARMFMFILRDVLFLLGFIIFWCGGGYLFHWLLRNIERTTLKHAGDEITLDDNEIRLVKADGTQIVFPREGLKIHVPYYAAGSMIFHIYRSDTLSMDEIVLTSYMENAKELVETIQPGSWDEGE